MVDGIILTSGSIQMRTTSRPSSLQLIFAGATSPSGLMTSAV
jgi:hypothetical protein